MKKEDKKKMLLIGIGAIGLCGLGYMLRKYRIEINDLKGDIDILRYHSEQDGIAMVQYGVAIDQLRDDLDIDNRTLTALYKQIEAIKKVIKWEVEEN